jgi:transcriptional regulator with XRE-family HTH domain
MDTKRQLARTLRAGRIERGLTQSEVGRALGLHRPAISEIEAGRRSVTSEELAELSRLFSIPVSDLLPPIAARSVDRPAGVREMIRQMARVIADRFDPRMVILFGSHARGTAGPDSDVDLLVVMDVQDSRRRTGARIGAALHDFAVPKDIVVTTPDAFRTRREVPGTIERSAAQEGEVLHAS